MSGQGHRQIAAILLISFLLGTCGTPAAAPVSTIPPTETPTLEPTPEADRGIADVWRGIVPGTRWLLASLDGQPPVEGTRVTIAQMWRGQMMGESGCGHYSVPFTIDGSRFEITRSDQSDFRCTRPGSADQRKAYFRALEAVVTYRVTPARLELYDENGRAVLVYTPQPLITLAPGMEETVWVLQAMRGQPLVEGSHISLRFGHQYVDASYTWYFAEGFDGVYRYFGTIEASDQGLLLMDQVGVQEHRLDEVCPPRESVQQQVDTYIQTIHEVASYQLRNGRLYVEDNTGETILLYAPQSAFDGDPGALAGTAWVLVSVEGCHIANLILNLTFRDGSAMTARDNCREFEGSYSASDGDLTISPIAWSSPLCSDPQHLPQGAAGLADLSKVEHFRLDGDRLELITRLDESMIFERVSLEATPEPGASDG